MLLLLLLVQGFVRLYQFRRAPHQTLLIDHSRGAVVCAAPLVWQEEEEEEKKEITGGCDNVGGGCVCVSWWGCGVCGGVGLQEKAERETVT